AASHKLAYISEARVQTHSSRHVVDLAFSNILFATAEVIDTLPQGADHKGTLIIIPTQGALGGTQHRLSILDEKLGAFAKLISIGTTSTSTPSTAPTTEDIDRNANLLLKALITTAKTISRRANPGGHSAP
ncbi:hypothetical protein LZ31DRAFT_612521, partial [Colletotrichum somersetense]